VVSNDNRRKNRKLLKKLDEIKTEKLEQENMKLKDKVEGLQDRIDSAINYIENNIDNTGWLEIGSVDVNDLLDILKGDNK
jgi:hypothetical protein